MSRLNINRKEILLVFIIILNLCYTYFLFWPRGNAVNNVYLSNNGLTTISASLLPWDKIDRITLDGNPWHCDCSFSWIISDNGYNLSVIDYDYLICKSPEHLVDLPVQHLSKENFGCSKYYYA